MPADPKLVRDHFFTAAELPAADRAAHLAAHCTDAELRAAVERLLAAHDEPASVLNRPAPGIPTADYPPITERPGTMIGPYKLMEQIGEGGFGVVFVAEQQEPVRRKVALKLIKPGMDSKQVIARFEAERQALALMDHPNIARVLDAGTANGAPDGVSPGRPYFVMELVRGIPITDYCDRNQLSPRERLELFVTVCHAIQHAHQKGIIHRDVKPSNVLVTSHDGKPVAKVIDFGVAKAIHRHLTERTIYTQFAQMIGTPLYMSPEQAEMSGLDIDTRSDIYSLGVLLYELLTGSTPLEKRLFARAAYDEIRRMIREEEPPRPSHRLSTSDALPGLAASRKTEPATLSRMFKGELDWVVMKALEKDRTRRYDTANGLARDIQRYLADEIVEARPPTVGYRLRKACRKNRATLTTAAIIMLLLLVGIAGSIWQAVRATNAERATRAEGARALAAEDQARRNEAAALEQQGQAESKAAESQALIHFIDTLIREGDKAISDTSRTRNRSFFEALDAAEPHIGQALDDHPLAEAQLRALLGDLYAYREDERAILQFERALVLRRQKLGPEHDETFKLMEARAQALEKLERWEGALSARQECINRQIRVHGQTHAKTFQQRIQFALLCFAARLPDRGRAATEALEKDLGELRARGGTLELGLVESFLELGIAYTEVKEPEKAVRWYREAGRAFGTNDERMLEDSMTAGYLINRLANAFTDAKLLAEALTWSERYAEALHAEPAGDDDWRMGWRGFYTHDPQAGWTLVEEFNVWSRFECGALIGMSHRPQDLQRIADMLSTHIAFVRRRWPDERKALAKSLEELGRCRLKQGRPAEAEPPLRESLAIRQKESSESWTVFQSTAELGTSELGQKKYSEAESHLLAGFTGLRERSEQMSRTTRAYQLLQAADGLVELYTALGKPDQVAEWQAQRKEQQLRLLALRANIQVQSGQVAEAVAVVAELTAAAPGSFKWTAVEWYDFACVYAVASGKLPDKKPERAVRAMELLHRAVQAGYKDAAHMKKDVDLDAVRDRADFIKLLAGLTEKPKKQADVTPTSGKQP